MSKTIYLEIMSSEAIRKLENDCDIPYRTRTAFESVKDNEIYFIEFGVGCYKNQGRVLTIDYLIKCNSGKGKDEYINIFDFALTDSEMEIISGLDRQQRFESW